MSELPLLSRYGPPDTGLPGSGLLSGGGGERPQRTRPAVIFKPANDATPWCYDPARPVGNHIDQHILVVGSLVAYLHLRAQEFRHVYGCGINIK